MTGLAPSILSFDMTTLGVVVPQMVEAGAPIIHFDVMDGQFVPPITFGDQLVRNLRPLTKALYEVHLMTETPDRHFEPFIEAGADRVIFHVEATQHPHRLAGMIRKLGASPGIALNPGTPVDAALALLDVVDEVLCMTVNPGWGGQSFIESVLPKIRTLRAARPDLLIEVDGGIDPQTLPRVQEAGANVFVVGSYLAKSADLTAATRELVAQC